MPCELGVTRQTVDAKIDNMEITIADVTDDFKLAMFQGLDFRGCRLEVIRVHYPECLTVNEFDYVFWGNLDTPSLDDGKSTFNAMVKNPFGNFDTQRTCMFGCNAIEFADLEECGAAKRTVIGMTASGTTQSTILDNARTEAEDYWIDGIVTMNFESRKVVSSSNGRIILEYPFTFAVSAGDTYTLENGCNKLPSGCKRHNNLANYSGLPGIPWELEVKT